MRLTFTIFNFAVHWGKIKHAVAVASSVAITVAVSVGNRSCKFLLRPPSSCPSFVPLFRVDMG